MFCKIWQLCALPIYFIRLQHGNIMPKDNVFPAINKQGVSVIRSSFVLENFHIFLEWKIGILSTETALFMDRSRHFILLSMKRWLLVDGNAKQPELFVEPVFLQNLFIVNTVQIRRRYFTINIYMA